LLKEQLLCDDDMWLGKSTEDAWTTFKHRPVLKNSVHKNAPSKNYWT